MVAGEPVTYASPEEYLAEIQPLVAAKKAELEKHEYQQYVKNLEVNASSIVQGDEKKEEAEGEEEQKEAPKKKKNKKKKKKAEEPAEELQEEAAGPVAGPVMTS